MQRQQQPALPDSYHMAVYYAKPAKACSPPAHAPALPTAAPHPLAAAARRPAPR